jgi:hypothetical protein
MHQGTAIEQRETAIATQQNNLLQNHQNILYQIPSQLIHIIHLGAYKKEHIK